MHTTLHAPTSMAQFALWHGTCWYFLHVCVVLTHVGNMKYEVWSLYRKSIYKVGKRWISPIGCYDAIRYVSPLPHTVYINALLTTNHGVTFNNITVAYSVYTARSVYLTHYYYRSRKHPFLRVYWCDQTDWLNLAKWRVASETSFWEVYAFAHSNVNHTLKLTMWSSRVARGLCAHAIGSTPELFNYT